MWIFSYSLHVYPWLFWLVCIYALFWSLITCGSLHFRLYITLLIYLQCKPFFVMQLERRIILSVQHWSSASDQEISLGDAKDCDGTLESIVQEGTSRSKGKSKILWVGLMQFGSSVWSFSKGFDINHKFYGLCVIFELKFRIYLDSFIIYMLKFKLIYPKIRLEKLSLCPVMC